MAVVNDANLLDVVTLALCVLVIIVLVLIHGMP